MDGAVVDELIAAAECVIHSYRAIGGYSVPLSINLQRLEAAVREYEYIVHAMALDSDVNGYDRSKGWGDGNSNQQSEGQGSHQKERQRCNGKSTAEAGREVAAQNEGRPLQTKVG